VFSETELAVGGEVMLQAVKWACLKGIADVRAICSAARTMMTGPPQPQYKAGREIIMAPGGGSF
jgi:hypothetical protein